MSMVTSTSTAYHGLQQIEFEGNEGRSSCTPRCYSIAEEQLLDRELLSGPICHLGGSEHLEVLFEAAQLGLDEGHDNDGFHFNLTEIADMGPEKCRAKLEELLAKEGFGNRGAAEWLLGFCGHRR